MKALMFAVILLGFSFQTIRADEPEFVIVTVLTTWANGISSDVGEVERAWGKTEKGYVIKSPTGENLILPLGNAHSITPGEAAIALIALREQMDRRIEVLCMKILALQGKPLAKAAPTQRNGSPLPPNWIDPAESDRRFQAQQLQQQLQQLQNQVQHLKP